MSAFETTPGLSDFASAARDNLEQKKDAGNGLPELRFVDHPLPSENPVTKGVAFMEMIGREQLLAQTPLTPVEQKFFEE